MDNREIVRKKIENYELVEHQKNNREIVLTGFPYWLAIDPANFCNLTCPLCPTGQGRRSRPSTILSFKILKRIIDEIGVYLIHIDFCNWGEPFLNNDIFKMIAYAKKFLIHTKLDTNFNIFDELKAENLVYSGLDKIILSIDGASQDVYEKYRRGGDFNKVKQNIELLIKTRNNLNKTHPVIEWQYLVFKHNEKEIEKAKEIAEELGVDEINFTAPYAGSLEWLTTLEEYRDKYYEVSGNKVEFKRSHRDAICNWLWDGITVNSDGSLSPCCSVEDSKDDFFIDIGRIKIFNEIWNHKLYQDARKHVLEHKDKPDDSEDNICLKCTHIGWSNHMSAEIFLRNLQEEYNEY